MGLLRLPPQLAVELLPLPQQQHRECQRQLNQQRLQLQRRWRRSQRSLLEPSPSALLQLAATSELSRMRSLVLFFAHRFALWSHVLSIFSTQFLYDREVEVSIELAIACI